MLLQSHSHRAARPFSTARPYPAHLRRTFVPQAAHGPSVEVEEGKRLLDQAAYKFLDVRSVKDYDREHITKPARTSINVPASPEDDFVARVAAHCPGKATKMLVACSDGGEASARATQQLIAAGYTEAIRVEGGFSAWTQVFSTSGRRRPPPGRWVSSGKEALKSGLNIPGVAESYDEGGNLVKARYAKGLADAARLRAQEEEQQQAAVKEQRQEGAGLGNGEPQRKQYQSWR